MSRRRELVLLVRTVADEIQRRRPSLARQTAVDMAIMGLLCGLDAAERRYFLTLIEP